MNKIIKLVGIGLIVVLSSILLYYVYLIVSDTILLDIDKVELLRPTPEYMSTPTATPAAQLPTFTATVTQGLQTKETPAPTDIVEVDITPSILISKEWELDNIILDLVTMKDNNKLLIKAETPYKMVRVFIDNEYVSQNTRVVDYVGYDVLVIEIDMDLLPANSSFDLSVEFIDEQNIAVDKWLLSNIVICSNLEYLCDIAQVLQIDKLICTDNIVINLDLVREFENLQALHISSDYLIGDLSALSDLNNIEYLHLRSELLESDIESLGNLHNMKYFDISGCNSVTGDISTFSNMLELTYLNVGDCFMLSGDLESMNTLEKLEVLVLSFNELTGSLSDISRLNQLKELDLWGCRYVTGDISDISDLKKLVYIDLTDCDSISGYE